MDGKISQFLKMQHDLAVEKGWIDSRTPEHAPFSILWSIDELGEAIAIIKKKGADGIMNNPSVREHFVEEVADTFMYLFDMMESYGITAEEFTGAYVKKYEHNMGRTWHENDAMYEKSPYKLVLFDLTENLPLDARFVEVLSRTELHLAAVSHRNIACILSERGVEPETFDYLKCGCSIVDLLTGIMEHTTVAPELTVLCTDSPATARIAKKLGMVCAVVSDTPAENADITLKTVEDLQDFLGFSEIK